MNSGIMNGNGLNGWIVSPCGMNCGVCYAFLRVKNKCSGCRGIGQKPAYCTRCIIINCDLLADSQSGYCFDCGKYPCKRMKQLDKRYRLKYSTSLIGNLEFIKAHGIDAFIKAENERWRCTNCGGTICIHTGICTTCK